VLNQKLAVDKVYRKRLPTKEFSAELEENGQIQLAMWDEAGRAWIEGELSLTDIQELLTFLNELV